MKNYVAKCDIFGRIVTGYLFDVLTDSEKLAVIAHEEGHIALGHVRTRFMWVFTLRAFFKTEAYFTLCRQQELDADRYAANQGHKAGLIYFLQRQNCVRSALGYPSSKQRLEALYRVRHFPNNSSCYTR